MATHEDLVAQGMAIFRGIVGRAARQLCTFKIARDRYCPAHTVGERGLYCERHRQQVDAEHQRLVEQGWED